jgi:hypothetical protein
VPPAPDGERVCPLAEINRPRRQQVANASTDVDHDRDAEARTARNTAVNWAASYMPDETRTPHPAPRTGKLDLDPWRRRRRVLNRRSRNGFAHD